MAPKYVIQLMFEWGGGCLWCGNDEARKAFDVGPIEDRLPLSDSLRRRLVEMTTWHDGSLNWEYPPDAGLWTAEEYDRFQKAASEILALIREELGADFEVVYKQL
ncbi:hypothetical protein AYO44_08275 [Planctomycetaceae bacterium SCGC AG-212-F19]|nr:hypothetical protein AYO44_08275 [Planctomycetaceae bacterium SCGC AG-212-F19]